MAYKKITITEDHIKLLQAIKFESFIFDGDSRNGRFAFALSFSFMISGKFPSRYLDPFFPDRATAKAARRMRTAPTNAASANARVG